MKAQPLARIGALACVVSLMLSVPGGTHAGSPTSISLSTAATVESRNVEVEGHVGGPVYAVAVQGSYAYVGEGPKLIVLDVSSPVSPTVVGKTPPLPAMVQAISVTGTYAYVAAGEGGLQVVDVSTPSDPEVVGSYDTPGPAQDVTVVGDYAYVAEAPVWDQCH
jgi:hypothetical protein